MSEVKCTMELAWKEHAVDMLAFEAWCRALEGDNCTGTSGGEKHASVHLKEEPSPEHKQQILDKWAALDDAADPMCASYKSKADRQAAKDVVKQSAKAKLAALGLNADEIAALVG